MSSAIEEKPDTSFLTLGAIIQTFALPNGSNIVLNFPSEELYQRYNVPYFGETIGRVANRISGARINNLNGRSYKLAPNNGPNCLHGGEVGWGKKQWNGPHKVSRAGRQATKFSYVSKDGDEGFPGEVGVSVWYTQYREKGRKSEDVNVLEIEYEAELIGHEDGINETVIGMTNHTYVTIFPQETTASDALQLLQSVWRTHDQKHPSYSVYKSTSPCQRRPDTNWFSPGISRH
jgi:aldose 1-epimerase